MSSCISQLFPLESDHEKVYIGMSINSFMSIHGRVKNEYLAKNTSVYSITYYQDKTGKLVVNSTSEVTYKKFYYFVDNKLVRVDKGERVVDYRIKIDN